MEGIEGRAEGLGKVLSGSVGEWLFGSCVGTGRDLDR